MSVLPEPPAAAAPQESAAMPRPLTGGAVMSGVSRVTVAVTGAAATILVARLLGPSGAGRYAIALSLVFLLTVASTLGMEHGIAYYVSSGRWPARSAYRDAQRVAFVSGVIGAGLGLLVRVLAPSAFGGLSVGTTAVAAAALPFALSWFYVTYIALAVDHYEAYVLPPAAQSTLALVLVGILAWLYGVPGAVAGFAAAHVLTALGTAVAARSFLDTAPRAGRGGASGSELRRALGFGLRGYSANALQILNYRLDLFLLASIATAADVGHYAIAVAVTSVMWLLPQALGDVLFPRVAALSARGDSASEQAREFVEIKTLRHTALVVAATTAALALALAFLVTPVYGSGFKSAIALGFILLPGVALLGIANTMSSTIVGRGHPGYLLAIALIVTPVTIALYLVLIPPLHASGAALASSISYSATFLLAAVFYRRVTSASVFPRLVPTASELADYRALRPAVLEWAGNLRARRAGSQP